MTLTDLFYLRDGYRAMVRYHRTAMAVDPSTISYLEYVRHLALYKAYWEGLGRVEAMLLRGPRRYGTLDELIAD